MKAVVSQRFRKYFKKLELAARRKLHPISQEKVYYFGYGANLAIDRFLKHGMNARMLGAAQLLGHQLDFSMACESIGQGYASVHESEGNTVWGALVELEKRDLELLDILEWVKWGYYERVSKTVLYDGKECLEAFVYVAKHPRSGLIPSDRYKKLMLSEAKKFSFPEDYIKLIDSFPAKPSFELDPTFSISNPGKRRELNVINSKLYRIHDKITQKIARLLP